MSTRRTSLLAALFALLLASPASALISAPEGSQFLYLTSGPEEAHGGGDTGEDLNGDGSNEFDRSLAAIEFEAGGAGTLSLYWDVLTGEVSGGVSDFVRIVLDGTEVLAESILTDDDTPLPPPGLDGFFDGPIGGPDGSFFEDGRIGWSMFSTGIAAGSHSIEFFVYDDDDDVVDTALLIDALALDGLVFEGFESDSPGSAPLGAFTEGVVSVEDFDSFEPFAVPEPATSLLGLSAAAGLVALRRRRR